MAPLRNKCYFNSNLQKGFRFMKSTSNSTSIVYCEMCKCEVDIISNSGHSNINSHLTKKTHQLVLKATSSSGKVINYLKYNTYSSDN